MLTGIVKNILLLLKGTNKPTAHEIYYLWRYCRYHVCFLGAIQISHRKIQIILNILQLLLGQGQQSILKTQLLWQLMTAQGLHSLFSLLLHQLIVFSLRKGKIPFRLNCLSVYFSHFYLTPYFNIFTQALPYAQSCP